MERVRKRRGVMRMKNEVVGIFIGRDGPEIFTGKEVNLIEEFF
jgi:hypothetical protein